MNARDHRPRGLPGAAIPAFVSLYLLLGTVPALVMMMAGYAGGSAHDAFMDHFVIYLSLISALMLTTIIGLSRGDVWGIRLFRAVAWCLLGIAAVGMFMAILLAAGVMGKGLVGARGTGEFSLAALFAACIPGSIMVRGLRHVRWLDPASKPYEWEASSYSVRE